MSNPAVGALYKRIMDQVIEISRTDFEENGVDNRMVATLQEKWQKHLTSKRSASFPWDPATQTESQPEPAAAPAKAQSAAGASAPPTAAASRPPATNTAASPVAASQPQSEQTSPTSVKQEAVNVKQEPGYDAAFSNYPAANNASYSSNPDVAAQRAQHLVQARYQQNQAQQQQGMNLGNIQLPGQQAAQQRPPYNQQRQGQLDGAGDDSADDINSDLDDSDDDSGDAMVGEDYQGDMIICLYDKVQRVKNKWKCTLKDGVASIGGKDYVFHRANGEYEW